jgi:beta-glucosidase
LLLGAPAALPWAGGVKAILSAYMTGQAGSGAIADLLLGKSSPSGKLAETWPESLEDTPCFHYYPGTIRKAEYRESIFTGYRYYDAGEKPVAFPFGHGLSYAKFEYSDLKLSGASFKPGEKLEASFTLKNTGDVQGAETAQAYVAMKDSSIFRAPKELKGFEKVFLQKGESRSVTIPLDARSFSYYNVPKGAWAVEGGAYKILIGSSSRDIRLRAEVKVEGDGHEALLQNLRKDAPEYFNMGAKGARISGASFEALYGKKLSSTEREAGQIDANSTVGEIKETEIGKKLKAVILRHISEFAGGEGAEDLRLMLESMVADMPLRSLTMFSGGKVTPPMVETLVNALNGDSDAAAKLHGFFSQAS